MALIRVSGDNLHRINRLAERINSAGLQSDVSAQSENDDYLVWASPDEPLASAKVWLRHSRGENPRIEYETAQAERLKHNLEMVAVYHHSDDPFYPSMHICASYDGVMRCFLTEDCLDRFMIDRAKGQL